MNRQLIIFCIGIHLIGRCFLQVVLPSWTSYPQYSTNGHNLGAKVVVIEDCMASCELETNCVAVDFNLGTSQPCWMHVSANDLIPNNTYYDNPDVTQYQIQRNGTIITDAPDDCNVQWQLAANTNSVNGIQLDVWTQNDCFTYCRYTSGCVAIDFDNTTSPPCWIHMSYDDLSPANTYNTMGVVQYRLNITCPAVLSTPLQMDRCSGQAFPSSGWCPFPAVIHVVDISYKLNPLCCYVVSENFVPPDSSWLLLLSTMYFAPSYYNLTIKACEGNTGCTIMAESYNNSLIDNSYCPDQGTSTNLVSISYICLGTGQSEPATLSTVSYVNPLYSSGLSPSSSVQAGRTTPIPGKSTDQGNGLAPASSQTQSQNNSSNVSLIIGLVVGLGGGFILIIIIVIVIVVTKKKRRKRPVNDIAMNGAPPTADPVANTFYYDSSTVRNDGRMDNQYNEIYSAPEKLDIRKF